MTKLSPGRHILAGITAMLVAAVLAGAGGARADDAAAKDGAGSATTGATAGAVAGDAKATERTAEKTEEKSADSAEVKTSPVEPKYVIGDVPMGDPDAPVTVIEYASFTCPHCATFHKTVWDKFKENYIDTGKVRFILRDVYFDKFGLWASMTARCAGPEGFYPMVDTYLKTQEVWTRAPDRALAIRQIGRRAGVSDERLTACLGDREYAKALLEDYKKNAAADDVRATPTFLINGEKATGAMPYDDFVKLIDAKL